MVKGLRYAVCKDCREIWNIAKNRDTSHGYICPRCERRRYIAHYRKDIGEAVGVGSQETGTGEDGEDQTIYP